MCLEGLEGHTIASQAEDDDGEQSLNGAYDEDDIEFHGGIVLVLFVFILL